MPNFAVISIDRDAFSVLAEVLGTPWFVKKAVDEAYENFMTALNPESPPPYL